MRRTLKLTKQQVALIVKAENNLQSVITQADAMVKDAEIRRSLVLSTVFAQYGIGKGKIVAVNDDSLVVEIGDGKDKLGVVPGKVRRRR